MKKLLLSIVIIMSLTSCEKEDPLQPEPVQNQPVQEPQPYDPTTDPTYVNPPNYQWCGCCQMNHPYVQYPPLWNGPRHPVQNCN